MSLQSLFWVVGISVFCWMAWGTWVVLRPNSFFLGNTTYTKPDYWALIGFWFALALAIYLPTLWVLNLIFPEHWGSYSVDDREWRSYSDSIAVLAATLGSLGIMGRMNKLQRSLLEKEFYTSSLFIFSHQAPFGFRPKEIDDCLAALQEVRPLFSNHPTAEMPKSLAEQFQIEVQAALTAGMDKHAAQLTALDKMAGTPAGKAYLVEAIKEFKDLTEGKDPVPLTPEEEEMGKAFEQYAEEFVKNNEIPQSEVDAMFNDQIVEAIAKGDLSIEEALGGPPPEPAKNFVVSEEEYQAAIARLKDKTGGFHAGIDPSVVLPTESVLLDANLVLSRVESAVVSSACREELIDLIKNERCTPRDFILGMVVAKSQSLLATGQYHIWRGVLNDEGLGIKATFDIALAELVKSGFLDDAGAKKRRVEVANAIASVG